MSSLAPDELWELKVLAARLLVVTPDPLEISGFAERMVMREIEDPEAMEILCERHPKVADLAPHLRRWAERHSVAPQNEDDAAFTYAADAAKRYLAGSLNWSELAWLMYKVDFLEPGDFRAGDLFWMAEFKSQGAIDMTEKQMNEAFQALSMRLLDCYARGDLEGWNAGLNSLTESSKPGLLDRIKRR